MRGPVSSTRRWMTALFVLVGSVTGLTPAQAYVLNPDGCHYAGTNPSIGYDFFSITSTYETVTETAAYRWNSTSIDPTFSEVVLDEEIEVRDYGYGYGEPYAWVSGSCDSSDHWYEPLELYYNETKMSTLTTEEKNVIGIHELGHTLGLAHNPTSSCGVGAGLMYSFPPDLYNSCGYSSPTSDDVAGVNAIY